MSRGKTPNQQTRRAILRRSGPQINNQNIGTDSRPWDKPALASFEIEPVRKFVRTRSGNVVLRPTTDDELTDQDLNTIAQMPYITSLFANSVILLREYYNFQEPPTDARQTELKKELSNLLVNLKEVEADSKAKVNEFGRITYSIDRRPAVFAVPTLAATHWNPTPPLVGETRGVIAMPDGLPHKDDWAMLANQHTYARDMHIPKLIPAIEQLLSTTELNDQDLMVIRVACLNWHNNEVSAIQRALSGFEKKTLTPEQVSSYWCEN